MPIILIFNSVVTSILFALAAFVPWSEMAKRDTGLQWKKYLPHAIGAGLFFALGNTLWFYTISKHLLGTYHKPFR